MTHLQTWPISQKANKPSGICRKCKAVRQLHLKDGTVHRHGPQDNPCEGSNQLHLSDSSQPSNGQLSGHQSSVTTPLSNVSGSINSPSSASVCDVVLSPTDQFDELFPDWTITSVPLIKHMPKSVRSICASNLAGLLNKVVSNPTNIDCWKAILSWSGRILPTPKREGKRHNVSAVIKKRISSMDDDLSHAVFNGSAERGKHPHFCLADAVASKLEDGNVRAAIRILCSDDKPAPITEETFKELQAKHPAAPADRHAPPIDPASGQFAVEDADILGALRSFPAGSSGGPDGLRPQHLLDMVNNREFGQTLLSSLTAFVNMLLRGTCHPKISSIFFGGRLIALTEKIRWNTT
jgi:hypothetical protein